MNPDQTESALGPYCLQYSLPKRIADGRAGDKSCDWCEKV